MSADDPSERPTLDPPPPGDPAQTDVYRTTRSSLPGDRTTIELVLEQVQHIPELVSISQKLFNEVQKYRYELEQRVSAAERRITKLEIWREEMEERADKEPT